MLSLRNPSLTPQKCHLIAEVCTQSGNALLLLALRSDDSYRLKIISEIKHLLRAYLHPHVGDEVMHNYWMMNNAQIKDDRKERENQKCPQCGSQNISKNGHRDRKQRYICKECGKQFLETYSPKGYPEEVKQRCLDLYREGMSFRGIEKKTGISHNTVINWVKQLSD